MSILCTFPHILEQSYTRTYLESIHDHSLKYLLCMALEDLPLDILFLIVELLDSPKDLASLTLVSRGIHHKTKKILFKEHGEIAFLRACENGQIHVIKILLANGVPVTTARPCGTNGLLLAAQKGHRDIVKLLIEDGLDVNYTNEFGISPLIHATSGGYEQTIAVLLAKGADVNIFNRTDGGTPLMIAAHYGYQNIMDILLKNGAEIDATDELGQTALFHAVYGRKRDVFQILIQRGADSSTENIRRKTVSQIARSRGFII